MPSPARSGRDPVDPLGDRLGAEAGEELLRVGPAGLREQDVAAEPGQELRELVGVPGLVQQVGAEHEIPRRGAKERLGLAPADARDTYGGAVPLGVAAQELDRVLRPVGREHLRTAQRRGERGQAEAAAELHDTPPAQLEARDVAREGEPARPQLGPVGQELLLVERRLVDQLVGARRPQDREPQPGGELDLLLDEVQDSDRAANRSTGTPSGSLSCA